MKDCPVCSIPMDEVPKSRILIDVCPRCKGIWLDRGELSKLMESIREYRDEYDELYDRYKREKYDDHSHKHYDKRDHDYKHHKKKKGVFGLQGDIFD